MAKDRVTITFKKSEKNIQDFLATKSSAPAYLKDLVKKEIERLEINKTKIDDNIIDKKQVESEKPKKVIYDDIGVI